MQKKMFLTRTTTKTRRQLNTIANYHTMGRMSIEEMDLAVGLICGVEIELRLIINLDMFQ